MIAIWHCWFDLHYLFDLVCESRQPLRLQYLFLQIFIDMSAIYITAITGSALPRPVGRIFTRTITQRLQEASVMPVSRTMSGSRLPLRSHLMLALKCSKVSCMIGIRWTSS